MKCAICNEETIGTKAKMWGCEFAHVTCLKAYSLGKNDTRALAAPTASKEPVARVNAEGFIVEVGDLLLSPGMELYATHSSAATPETEPSDAERLAFIAESKSGTIRLDGDGYNPDDFRAFAPVYVHWNAPQSTLRDAIDAAIRATKGGKL